MQQIGKFTGPFKNQVTFDKNEIRKQIIIPNYRQARRGHNIYGALVRELHEEGCPTSAKYFQILIDKEQNLYDNNAIRDRISDEHNLLLTIFDSCKMAEKAALLGQCNSSAICSRLLLQCILEFQNYDKKYDWILMDVFRIIVKIATKVCQDERASKESICQIYYKFGTYLTKSDLEEAVTYLEKSFNLARGYDWIDRENSICGKSQRYSSTIAKNYATALLDYANKIFQTETEKALALSQKSVVILTGEGIDNNRGMYVKAYLDMAEFKIVAKNFEASLAILEHIIKYILPYVEENIEYMKFLSRYYHLKGNCMEGLQKYDVALIELQESLKIVRKLHMKHNEGCVLLGIAKVYITRGRSQYHMADLCLRQAKELFVEVNDIFNVKKTSYLMANLKVENIKPMLLDLIKFSSINFCDKYRLYRWKSICRPFWRSLQSEIQQEERRPLECILAPTCVPDKKAARKSFQRKPPKN